MPPKKKKLVYEVKVFKSTIKADKYEAELRDITERHKAEAEAAEEEYDDWLEEEMEEEEDEDRSMSLSEIDWHEHWGRIDLSFPETTEQFENSPQCYPPSYYTLSSKERLLLLYAENFRKQFIINYPKRRPLVLAVPNECNVQKFVSQTIRPTAFVHLSLIGSVEGCASFVADFIIYEPLEDMMSLPKRLVSPATLLRRRRGNSYEMATLLCSMLIGAGYPAMVCSGVARADTVSNDQRNVEYPHKIIEVEAQEEEKPKETTGKKYKLRPMPDLESHLEENIAEMKRIKAEEEQKVLDEALRLEREELELRAVDRYHYRRCHAWVAIIDNAPWSIKPRKTYVNEDGDVVEEPPKARFIEPSTGFECDTNTSQYILLDSVWNQYNYYINRQEYQRISELRWDLRNTADWEHFLPGEPPEMRQHEVVSEENITEGEPPEEEEKHLDMIRSWVLKPHIGMKEFEERFPKLEKTIHYKRAIHERFSPYSQRDGKVMQLTLFSDDEYKAPVTRWEYFENRADLLTQLKYTYATKQIEENFKDGRDDSLKFMEYNTDSSKPKYLHFYSAPRLDSLKFVEIHPDLIILNYSDRADLCFYQEFGLKPSGASLKKIVEKFNRNPDLPANKDIAVRTFMLNQRKIILKFHYARGALTSSYIEYTKPPRPDYGQEIKYDPSLTKLYKANVSEPDPTPLELYKLLLAQLKCEDKMKKEFEKIMEELNRLLDHRKQEMRHPVLKFRIFDPLRNGAARALRLKQHAEEEAFKLEMSQKPADFLAPYLVPYKKRELTYEESWAAYNACLNDLKTRFVGLLNDLQRQYEDLTTEAKSLKRFLNKFENQFDNYDYERLVKEAKDIELNKRMVQQRLTLTHEESQKKYEVVKESLMTDPRLNLRRQTTISDN